MLFRSPGNHDRGVEKAGTGVPLYPTGFELSGWRIVHGDQPAGSGRVVLGHWHPALFWQGRKTPCFLASKASLILPAFSLDVQALDLGADVKAVSLEILETESREPLRGKQATDFWSAVFPLLCAGEPCV